MGKTSKVLVIYSAVWEMALELVSLHRLVLNCVWLDLYGKKTKPLYTRVKSQPCLVRGFPGE